MKTQAYTYKPGAVVSGKVSAQVAGERLAYVRQQTGVLTARVIVDDATDEASPIHPAFEWNDSRAADHYRLDQAQNLLRAIVVHIGPDHMEPTRAFINIGKHAYEDVNTVLNDAVMRGQMVMRALAELNDWTARYQQYQELAVIFEAAEQVKAQRRQRRRST